MTLPLTRADVEHVRDQHTPTRGPGVVAWCKPCQQLHPCVIHQLADKALAHPDYTPEEA